jgi:hypothetical protein
VGPEGAAVPIDRLGLPTDGASCLHRPHVGDTGRPSRHRRDRWIQDRITGMLWPH